MDEAKRRRLEASGFRVGSASEFLGLSDAENGLVELKLALSAHLRQLRTRQNLSQTTLARRLKSSQSRIAKMEAGDPSVSVDLLFRALFALGATRQTVAEMIRSTPSAGYERQPVECRDKEEVEVPAGSR
jgi:DNA-binding XRE family transcriptional regulator